MKAEVGLAEALREVVDKIDASVRSGGYHGEPIKMYLAGGLAVHYYTRARYTHDIDASFSQRLILPYKELIANFTVNGERSVLFFDQNYNPSFALLHPDYQADAKEWQGLGNETRVVKLHVLAPVDLATSKLLRFSEQDRLDIDAFAQAGLVTAPALRARANQALDYYIGNKESLLLNVATACRDVENAA
jgi:hypothetical protein